jgi:hypothetical protein
LERYWNASQACWLVLLYAASFTRSLVERSELGEKKIVLSESNLPQLVSKYFSRRWFKRVWVLQEVALPDLCTTTVICSSKVTTAERALHLFSILEKQGSSSLIWIFILLCQRIKHLQRSPLLDILIESCDCECKDLCDKIFGVLNIVCTMDKGKFPDLKTNYRHTVSVVYAYFSVFFIQHHSPGFFLSLIKSLPKLNRLLS